MAIYLGLVVDNNDDENMGRIRVECPELYGENESPYALPCVPFTSKGSIFYPPEIGEPVWIMLNDNDVDEPVWVGTLKDGRNIM